MLPQWQPPESKGITTALRPSRSSVLRNVGREIELILGDAQRHPVLPWDFVGLWRMAVNAEDTIAEDDVVRRLVLEIGIPGAGLGSIERLAQLLGYDRCGLVRYFDRVQRPLADPRFDAGVEDAQRLENAPIPQALLDYDPAIRHGSRRVPGAPPQAHIAQPLVSVESQQAVGRR